MPAPGKTVREIWERPRQGTWHIQGGDASRQGLVGAAMTTSPPPGDVLGFSREARGFGAGVCLSATPTGMALSDEMAAEGITGDRAELSRRHARICTLARACPAAGACRAPDCVVAHPEKTTFQLSIFPL